MSYRKAPVPLPSLLHPATALVLGMLDVDDAAREDRARSRAAAAPCPAFVTGEPICAPGGLPARGVQRLGMALLRGLLDE